MGDRINIPLFPFVARVCTFHGSFWGNDNDLKAVVTLAERGLVRRTVKVIRLEDVDQNLELLRAGEIVGRAVIRHG